MDGKVGQKGFNFRFCHFSRVPFVMEENIAADPFEIGLLGGEFSEFCVRAKRQKTLIFSPLKAKQLPLWMYHFFHNIFNCLLAHTSILNEHFTKPHRSFHLFI